jgi:hypothetical protein
MSKEAKQAAISVEAKHDTLAPRFATGVNSRMSVDYFMLDFFYYDGEKGIHLSRIALSPEHIKRMRDLLDRQIKQYERQFGRIRNYPDPDAMAKKLTKYPSGKTKRKSRH